MGLLLPLLRVTGKAPGRDAGRLRSPLDHLRHFDELGSGHATEADHRREAAAIGWPSATSGGEEQHSILRRMPSRLKRSVETVRPVPMRVALRIWRDIGVRLESSQSPGAARERHDALVGRNIQHDVSRCGVAGRRGCEASITVRWGGRVSTTTAVLRACATQPSRSAECAPRRRHTLHTAEGLVGTDQSNAVQRRGRWLP